MASRGHLRYSPRCYWFIVFDCFRRLSQTGLLIFVHPGSLSQILVGIFFSLLSLAVLSRVAPYIDPTNDTLAFVGQLQRAPASDRRSLLKSSTRVEGMM